MSLRLVALSSPPRPADLTARAVAQLSPLLEDIEPLTRLEHQSVVALLRDLGFALAELLSAARRRVVIPAELGTELGGGSAAEAGSAAWEVALERDAGELLVSVFKPGLQPQVVQADRRVGLERAQQAVLGAIGQLCEDPHGAPADGPAHEQPASSERGLELARRQLRGALPPAVVPRSEPLLIVVRSPRRCQLHLSAEIELRRQDHGTRPASDEVARADLHALLFRGRLTLRLKDCVRRLHGLHVFLFVEQLVRLAGEVHDAAAARRRLLRRVPAGGASCGVRLDEDGLVTLLIAQRADAPSEIWQLPKVPAEDFVHDVAAFGRTLGRRLVKADRSQLANLRLTALRHEVAQLSRLVKLTGRLSSKLNRAPESYRAFAESDDRRTVAPASERASSCRVGKLRFNESWRAAVPEIDLPSVTLYGDRLIVGTSHELACIERASGELLWCRPTSRAVSVITSVGLVRLGPDGLLKLIDLRDGEIRLSLRLGPASGPSTSGAVVSAPGLPHLMLLSEGAEHLVAVDLDSGEIRWRRAVQRSGILRLRRAGKLMLMAGGEPYLAALDLLTGEEIWRLCGDLRYSQRCTVDRSELFAVSTEGPHHAAAGQLQHVDPWSGAVRWTRPLPRPVQPVGSPLPSSDAVLLITLDGDRLGVMAFDRHSGELRFDRPGGLCDAQASCLVVDDKLIANSETGELVAIACQDGSTCYRQVFAPSWHGAASDRPHSTQPVLRSGALFLPQSEVYVVRPADGAMLGRLPGDFIPDVLRVDERCGVYIAEASGHVAAYEALPILTLVSPVG